MDGDIIAAPPRTDKLAEALAKAQADITSPARNREVTVMKKAGGSYKFRYATLDSIIDHVRPHLTANGLWFVQTLENGDGKYRLVTTLLHASGQSIRSETPILLEKEVDNQVFGSALTYMRRYALTALLGIAADEDDDANTADGNTIKEAKDRPVKDAAVKKADSPRITEVKTRVRELVRELKACSDMDQLDGVVRDAAQTIEDCRIVVPDWFHGDGKDVKGLAKTIEECRADIEAQMNGVAA